MMNTKEKNLLPDENSLLYKIASEKAFYLFLLTFMLALPICEMITQCFGVPFVSQPFIVTIYGCLGMLMVVLKLLMRDKQRFVVYPSDIFFVFLIFFAVISLIFSCNLQRSLNGFDYDELIYHFLAYYSLMYAGTTLSSVKLRKKILLVFAIVGSLHCIIALFQTFGFELAYCYYTPDSFLLYKGVYTLTQNSNWYGGLSVVFVAVFSGFYLLYSNTQKQWAYLLLSGFALYCSMCSKARLAWIGNTCIILFYLVSLAVMRTKYDIQKITKRFALLLLVFVLSLSASQLFYQAISYNVQKTIEQSGQGSDAFGSMRGYIWRYGLSSVPHHWLTGIGLDNYAEAFFENPDWDGKYFQDKGHNEYLHTLVTQGVFAALNYIIMLIYACITGVKTVIHTEDDEERRITWILLGMFIGYATQAFFNSSVINVAPYFWIIVGMTMPKKHQKPLLFKKQKNMNPQS